MLNFENKKKNKPIFKMVTARVLSSEFEEIKIISSENDITVSMVVRELIRNSLEEHKNKLTR